MKRALMTLAGATVLGLALPALAGQPIGWFDERYPLETNKVREAFPNQPKGTMEPPARPYALTGKTTAARVDGGWHMSVDTVGREPRTIYRR